MSHYGPKSGGGGGGGPPRPTNGHEAEDAEQKAGKYLYLHEVICMLDPMYLPMIVQISIN